MIEFTNCSCKVAEGKFNIDTMPLDCPAVFRLIGHGHTVGVFQLENKLGQDWAKAVKPQSLDEIAALISVIRPGPLEAGLSKEYVDVKFGRKKPSYLHPSLKPILESTQSCMIYQEQILRIAADIAGFDPVEADTLRKGVGKKDSVIIAKLKTRFITGCQKHSNVTEDVATEIFEWIEKCQRYSFNKCVAGDTVIQRPARNKHDGLRGYSVSHMYNILNNLAYAKKHGHTSLRRKWRRLGNYGRAMSLYPDKRIRPNTIKDIQPAGEQRLYKITTESHGSIRATINHKFPTPNGIKTVVELTPGDILSCCGEYEKTDFKICNRYSNETKNRQRRPYDTKKCGFLSGSQNPAYTNGSFTSFREYQDAFPNVCQQCGKTNCRIETAHLNGDRSNSNWDNLKKLCPSCHKKHDYLHGRTRKGEKGYPENIDRIISIEPDGFEQTWNVEMEAPCHNFVVNDGILTSNSHATSYGLTAYQTAWIKCHFPHEFFTSWLTFSRFKSDPKEEVYRLVQDARFFDVDILPPDARRGNVHFKIVEQPRKGVAFGLSHIRGVGSSAIKKIVTGHKLATWKEFLLSVPGFHRNVGLALIKSGACDGYYKSRAEMVAELEVVLGTTSRDHTGKKVEIRGLTEKEKGYFFNKLDSDIASRDILLEMSQPPQLKHKTLVQMKKDEIVEFATTFLSGINSDFGIMDGNSTFTWTSEAEKDTWLSMLSKKTKQAIADILIQNGYNNVQFKPPCSSDARRKIMTEKATILQQDFEDDSRTKAAAEKHFLGIALSCSEADDADSSLATHTCLDVAKSKNGDGMSVCAIIDAVKHTKTKRGRNPGSPMCFLTLSDSTYSIDHAVVFPDSYEKLKAFCKEDIICLIYGQNKNGSFIVQDMQKLI